MVPVIGYGEDGLTFGALTHHLTTLLGLLGDDSKPEECLVFYRPSFGRGRGRRRDPAEFGEFDGILATRRAVYPVEAKWARSATRGGLIKVKPRQVLRHQIFEWLRGRWAAGTGWKDFAVRHEADFKSAFGGKPLAPIGSKALGPNIEYILERLTAFPPAIRHLVLVFHRQDREKPLGVAPCGVPFELVPFRFEALNDGGLFALERGPQPPSGTMGGQKPPGHTAAIAPPPAQGGGDG